MNAGTRDRTLAWVALAVGLALYVVTQVLPLLDAGGVPRSHQNDFKHLYVGALILARDGNPYDAATLVEYASVLAADDSRFGSPTAPRILPYVYLPFTGQVMRPLAWMSFARAASAWLLANHAMLIASLVLGASAAGWRWRWQSIAWITAAVVLNTCLFRQNNAGQLNNALLLGYALIAFAMVRRWHPAVAGSIAAAIALFKLTPAILIVWFVLRRRWREAAWMAGVGAVLLAVSTIAAGVGTSLDFVPLAREMGYGHSTWSEFGHAFWRDPFNQSPNSFFHHVLVTVGESRPWFNTGAAVANGATWLVSLAILAAFGWAGWKGASSEGEGLAPAEAASYSAAVLASLLLPSIMWDHYLVQALLPCLLLWPSAGVRGRVLIGACVAIYCVNLQFGEGFAGSRLLGTAPVRIPVGGGAGWLLTSLKLWPTLALFGFSIRAALRTLRTDVERTGNA